MQAIIEKPVKVSLMGLSVEAYGKEGQVLLAFGVLCLAIVLFVLLKK